MQSLELVFQKLANMVWGNWLIMTLMGTGLYFSVITNFIQIRKLPLALYESLVKPFKHDLKFEGVGTLTPFQTLCTALGSCVGNGNIVGVATAIVSGGPGALFWMWIAAFLGMATKYAEILIGMIFRIKAEDGNYISGPMYYIEKGLRLKVLAKIFSILLVIQICGGNLIQSNAVSGVLNEIFGLPIILSSIILAFFVGLVVIGGIQRLGKVTEKLVPFMAILYIVGGLIVILANITVIPATFKLIITSAFSLKAGIGGAVGYGIRRALRYGVSRGLYSNEAGEGSAPVLHASAITDHPVRQALFGLTEVFIDTFILCSITGFVILATGTGYQDVSAGTLTSVAFGSLHPIFRYVVGIAMILFAFSSIPAQWYFGQVGLSHLIGAEKTRWFRYFFVCFTFLGGISSLKLVWYIQDFILGILIIPNLFAILLLSPLVTQYTKDFFSGEFKYSYLNINSESEIIK